MAAVSHFRVRGSLSLILMIRRTRAGVDLFRAEQCARVGGRASRHLHGLSSDLGAFKTPSLREVSRTAPYMHDGSLTTLSAVIDFYDGGGRPNPLLDPRIHPLRLTPDEKRDLLAFLNSLSGRMQTGE